MTTVRSSSVGDAASSLRAAMVEELRGMDAITSGPVARAVARVPRHLFAPGEPLEQAYAANSALVTKRDASGAAISSVSAAHIQAVMLEQADISPGMRVLEVGSGGYNAALLAELVGPEGAVTSLDIDPDIVARARTCLAASDYHQVDVVLADAQSGAPERAPYDRILVTAGAWDIAPAWIDQLTEHGRIVVPLRMRGLTRSIAFDRDDSGLVSRSYRLCGFVPMQGAGSYSEHVICVDDSVVLRVDETPEGFDVEELTKALRGPRLEYWSGAAYDMPDELELFLITSAPQVALLHASDELIAQGTFAASAARGVPAIIHSDSVAYRTRRPNEDTGGYESGVIAHGPQAEAIATQYVQLLRRWAADHRRRGAALIRYTPRADTAPDPSAGLMTKRHGTLTVTWP